MRVVVAGLGVQGQKRKAVAGSEVVATVDPVHPEAQYKRIEDVPVGINTVFAYVCAKSDLLDMARMEFSKFAKADSGKPTERFESSALDKIGKKSDKSYLDESWEIAA